MRARVPVLLVPVLLVPVLLLLPAASAAALPAPPIRAPAGTLWVAPLDGAPTVTRAFERLPHPYAAGHRGVDLQGPPFGSVVAAGDGTVVFAGTVAGRPVVSIDHAGGLRTTYEPVEPSVAAGLQVRKGSPIGTLATGHVGCPAQACLHWGLRRGDTYLDPLLLLRPPRVRLLPLGGPVTSGPAPPRRSRRGPRRPPTWRRCSAASGRPASAASPGRAGHP